MKYREFVEKHLHTLTTRGRALDAEGQPTPFWMSSIDFDTWNYPSGPPAVGKRVYRNIDAPFGSSLYWDQPTIEACFQVPGFENAAQEYLKEFLGRCVAHNGLFLWGNHYFYRASTGQVMRFVGNEAPYPVDFETEAGDYHETRPIMPDWNRFWQVDAEATEKCLRAIAQYHLFDPATGGFNRHADERCSHAFLESGGILAHSLCYLAASTGDTQILDLGVRVARWSFQHRGSKTGLLENQPCTLRWDKYACTSEVGHWALSLMNAAELLSQSEISGAATAAGELQEMAGLAVGSFLKYGFDSETGKFYGELRVADGTPVREERQTLYEPDLYGDFWNPLFPRHDYPFQTAQACAALWQKTGSSEFLNGLRRWTDWLQQELPPRGGTGTNAEFYGHCIQLLLTASDLLHDEELSQLAEDTASGAIKHLWQGSMFAGHAGERRYDAVDGVGYLLLALNELDRRRIS